MSLIYDYLKIYGKGNSGKDSGVEIPPTLKRSSSNTVNSRSAVILFGACCIGALVIFLVIKIISPGSEAVVATRQAASPASAPQQQIAAVKDSAPEQDQAAAAEPAFVTTPDFAIAKNEIQVFPESVKGEHSEAAVVPPEVNTVAETSALSDELPSAPIELNRRISKIVFPEPAPAKRILQETAAVPPADLKSEANRKPVLEPTAVKRTIRQAAPSAGVKRIVRPAQPSSSPGTNRVSLDRSSKFYQAGLQAQQQGDQRSAEIYYNEALKYRPTHIDSMVNLSAIYVQQQRYAEAEDILTSILRLDPDNSNGLVNMGMIKLYQDNEFQAETYFKAALDANPAEENALVNLAYLAEKKKDYAATERYYKHLLQISSENLEVLLAYGHLLEETGRYPEAAALYSDSLELDRVKKDRMLYSNIMQRMRLLAGISERSDL